MTDPNEAVTPSAPAADPDPDPTLSSPAAAVSAVDDADVMVGDRPLKNVIAELDRKNAQRIDAVKAELLAALGSVQRPQPSATREYTDEELSQLATAGDARANLELTRRLAARESAAQIQSATQVQTEQAQLGALFGRYPVLRDDSHPLTQYAMQVKTVLLQRGAQNTAATTIEAIKTAIADNPDLAAQSVARPATSTATPRPTVPTAAAAAPATRRSPAPTKTPTLTDQQWTVAKRYGYKTREDAAKAIANFERRQASGQSKLGAVGAMIREDA